MILKIIWQNPKSLETLSREFRKKERYNNSTWPLNYRHSLRKESSSHELILWISIKTIEYYQNKLSCHLKGTICLALCLMLQNFLKHGVPNTLRYCSS